ncbi:MAG: diguanylate cyclase [Chloroflexota bacterium]|nr:diguanylate cyclase [Dehalococcoidia bacterium]MDW8254099.1 diguanylate cyclase [Chloroflexota bacterium]
MHISLTEESVERVLALITGPAILVDRQGCLAGVNRRLCDLVGAEPEELLRTPGRWARLPTEPDFPPNGELPLHTPTGEERWLRWRPARLDTQALGIEGVIWSAEDVTAEREQRRRREIENRQLHDVFENAGIGMAFANLHGRFLRVNHSLCELTGYREDELLRMTGTDLSHPEDRRIELEQVRRLLNGEIPSFELEKRFIRRDGTPYWVQVRISRLDGDPEPILLTQIEDIQHRKDTEQALRESEERLRRLLDNAADVIYRLRVRPQKRYEYVSNSATRVFGYAPEEWYRDPELCAQVCHPDDRAKLVAPRSPSEWASAPIVVRMIRKDGRVIWTEHRVTPLLDERGEIVGFDAIVRDITESRRAEEKQREAAEALAAANQQLTEKIVELEQRNREVAILRDMVELLQLCISTDEAYDIVARYGPQLFPRTRGSVAIIKASRNAVDRVCGWGDPQPGDPVFGPNDCWSLRRGRPHLAADLATSVTCPHLRQGVPTPSLCVPLASQGEAFGVLTLQMEDARAVPESQARLASSVAEQIALALANLALREQLRSQSIRDPLTDLYNRRFLEETLERELMRAQRLGRPLSVMMIDIDHFKRFNDDYGHDAGDAVLREIAALLKSHTRAGDVACRYGGEEFVILLPELPEDVAARRAEELREAVHALAVFHRGRQHRALSVSIGVASSSLASSVEDLLALADAALYQAKHEGRDRVVVASRPADGGTPAQ